MCISRRYYMKVLHIQVVMNTCPASLGRKAVSTGVAIRQRVQQCLCLLQVSGVKPLGEPMVDRCQQGGSLALALLLPQAGQAHRRPQLQRLRLLAAGHVAGLVQAGGCFSLMVCRCYCDSIIPCQSRAANLCARPSCMARSTLTECRRDPGTGARKCRGRGNDRCLRAGSRARLRRVQPGRVRHDARPGN